MTEPTYTFVSVSTAKPGRLDDLARLASEPSEKMEGNVPGMLARQVSVDRDRNTVVVWVTFARRPRHGRDHRHLRDVRPHPGLRPTRHEPLVRSPRDRPGTDGPSTLLLTDGWPDAVVAFMTWRAGASRWIRAVT
jgi:hypothetical protein